jgi:hypothetical protein
MSILNMLVDIIRQSGGRNAAGQVGSTVGGLIGNIWGPIGHLVGQDIGSEAGRVQNVLEGDNLLNNLLGGFVVDPITKPLGHMLPIDMLFGGPKKKK